MIINAKDHVLYKKRVFEQIKSETEINTILQSDKTSKKILDKNDILKHGDLIGARLNLNIFKNTSIPVLTVHSNTNKKEYRSGKGFYTGKVRTYKHILTLKNAYFNVNQKSRANIFLGKKQKHAMASVDGEYQETSEVNIDGIEVKFNPKLHHLFVDEQGNSIKSAEEVTLYGHRAYLRGNIEYYSKNNAPRPENNCSTESKYID